MLARLLYEWQACHPCSYFLCVLKWANLLIRDRSSYMKTKSFYNHASTLWPEISNPLFKRKKLSPIRQQGPTCVATAMAMLTGSKPEYFQGVINTQNPVSWSDALKPFGMKLAYCPTDARRISHYIDELVDLDDLFTLSYYMTRRENVILQDPNEEGWVCGSHIVVLHKDKLYDPMTGVETNATDHECLLYHTKRIFRVVPNTHVRGL